MHRLLPLFVMFGALGLAQDPAALSQQGKQAMAERRFGDAAKIYAQLAELVPNNPGLLLNQGMALSMAGNDPAAIAPLEKAVELEPRIFPAWMFLGGAYLRLGQPAKAVAPLEKAFELDGNHPQVRGMLGDAYQQLGRPRDALGHWQALAGVNPQDPVIWVMVIQSYQGLAGEAFSALQEKAPESAEMVRLLADLRLAQQQYPSALYLYRLANEREPSMRGVHAAMAEIYRATGHADWAATAEAAEAELGEPDCSTATLECDFLAGRLEKVAMAKGVDEQSLLWRAKAASALADRAFQKLDATPDSTRKYELLASLFAEQKRNAESAAEWKKALAAEPGNQVYQAQYATQLYLARDNAAARPLIEKMLAASPNDAQWNFFLGDIHLQALDAEKAAPLLEKAVAADANLLPARHALGRAYMSLEEPEKAIPHLRAALEIDQDGSLHYQLAQALIRTGKREEARAPMEVSRKLQQSLQAQQAEAQEMEITAPTAR